MYCILGLFSIRNIYLMQMWPGIQTIYSQTLLTMQLFGSIVTCSQAISCIIEARLKESWLYFFMLSFWFDFTASNIQYIMYAPVYVCSSIYLLVQCMYMNILSCLVQNLSQDVSSYQRVIDSSLEKAQGLATSTNDPNLTDNINNIRQRYQKLTEIAKVMNCLWFFIF
jgi:hypothetical protein